MTYQPIILGLDVATTTGWAVSTSRKAEGIQSGYISGKKVGNKDPMYTSAKLQDELHSVLQRFRNSGKQPNLCVMEAPLGAAPNPTTLAKLYLYYGALNAVCRGYGIPCLHIPSATWRKTMYGFGKKPGFDKKAWKKHAIHHCQDFIKVDVNNADEAEAVLISQYGFYTQAFKEMVRKAEIKGG